MARSPRNTLTLPHLIVCEGAADEAFLRALCKHRELAEVSIRHPGDVDRGGRGGLDKLGWLLRGIGTWRGFEQVTDILVVADNDTDPAANFARVRHQVANAGYPAPETPLAVAEGVVQDLPRRLRILMLPWADRPGSLETLCLGPARAAEPALADCADAFAACARAAGRDQGARRDQFLLRVLLAAGHPPDPRLGLGLVWQRASALIPLGHADFDPIAGVLADFAARR